MTLEVTPSGAEDLNDPSRWINIQQHSPPVNTEWFQEELNKITGLNVSGLPILRVVWGCDRDLTSQIIFGERRLRYKFFSKRFLNGDVLDLGVPRFFLEELNEPGQARESWERQRYYVPEDHRQILDCLGPYPEKGYYTCFWTIARHDGGDIDNGACCDRVWQTARRTCWGLYREPAEIDLQRVRRAWQRQVEHRKERPDRPLPISVLHEAQAASFESLGRWRENLKAKTSDMIDDFLKTHAFSFTSDDPSVHKWGKWHWMGGHNKSGNPTFNSGSN